MKDFSKSNPNLIVTMKSHLIDDLDSYGVWLDDYEKFIQKRGRRVLKELQKRLNPSLKKTQ